MPRPPRKLVRKARNFREPERQEKPGRLGGERAYYEPDKDYYIPSTPENTSLSSTNSLQSTASNEQSSSESLTQRRRAELERRLERQERQARLAPRRFRNRQEDRPR